MFQLELCMVEESEIRGFSRRYFTLQTPMFFQASLFILMA